MLWKNVVDRTRNILKAAASREQTSTIPSVKGGGAFANLKMAENYFFGQMFYPNGMGWGLF